MGWLFDSALNWLTSKLLEGLDALWSLLLQTALNIPDVTALPQVGDVTATSLMIVNVCFVLAIITAGVVVMTRETLQVRYGIAELGPRLVLGFIAANMSPLICSQLITLANAVTQALAGESAASSGSFDHLHAIVKESLTSIPSAVLAAVLVAIMEILTALMLVQWLIRLGVLLVLVGIAPVALACHALPQTEPAAKLWWRAMLGTVATVVLQAVALHTALSIFLNPQANTAALGLPHAQNHVFDMFIVVCLLLAVLKIPGLMRRYVTKSGGGGGGIGRFVIIQQLTRAVTKVVTKAPARPRSPRGGGAPSGGSVSGGGSPRPTPIGGGRRVPPPRPAGRNPGPTPVGRDTPTRRSTAADPGRRPAPGATTTSSGNAARAGRPVRPYTPEQLRGGVDSYTPVARRRAGVPPPRTTTRRPNPQQRPTPGSTR